MRQRFRLCLVVAGTWFLCCTNPDANARRDTVAALARLRQAGFLAHIESTDHDPNDRLYQLRSTSNSEAIIVIIARSEVVIGVAGSPESKVNLPMLVHTRMWSRPFAVRGDQPVRNGLLPVA